MLKFNRMACNFQTELIILYSEYAEIGYKENKGEMMTKANHLSLGRKGEEVAAEYLKEKGYDLLFKNYRAGNGEIDIIARNKGIVVIIEVKSYQAEPLGAPEFRVNKNKQKMIIRTAHSFLAEYEEYRNLDMRFDVILVNFSSWPVEITHHKAAFYNDNYWNDNYYNN